LVVINLTTVVNMVDSEIPIGTIRERLRGLLADWGADFSDLLTELEDKRARLAEFEADEAHRKNSFNSLNKRVEAQDSLIETLNMDAGEAASLRKEIREHELELERKNSEIHSKQDLIGALRRDAKDIGRLRGDGRVKDQEIARLQTEKEQAEQRVAEVSEEFSILSASTLTGIDASAELEAVRAELDARKVLIDSLRGDADRAKALESELDKKRSMIGRLEASIDRYATTISELRASNETWKQRCADSAHAGNAGGPLSSLSDEELQALTGADNDSDISDSTIAVDMRASLLEAQETGAKKISTNR
jgi:chromosome segregation ATPase